jgi:hypothetical protein
LSRKEEFSAGGLQSTCKTRIRNSNVAICAQREKLLCEDEKAELLNRNGSERQATLLLNAQEAMHMYDTIVSNVLNEKDWGFIILPEAKASGQMADLKKKATIIANYLRSRGIGKHTFQHKQPSKHTVPLTHVQWGLS